VPAPAGWLAGMCFAIYLGLGTLQGVVDSALRLSQAWGSERGVKSRRGSDEHIMLVRLIPATVPKRKVNETFGSEDELMFPTDGLLNYASCSSYRLIYLSADSWEAGLTIKHAFCNQICSVSAGPKCCELWACGSS
jgi:hypothetical protein